MKSTAPALLKLLRKINCEKNVRPLLEMVVSKLNEKTRTQKGVGVDVRYRTTGARSSGLPRFLGKGTELERKNTFCKGRFISGLRDR